jgi:helix-turn-helix protein
MSNLLENYLTEPALAAELGKGLRTLQLWRARRVGPPWTKNGNRVLYPKDGVLRWLEKQQVEPVRQRRAAVQPQSEALRR